MSLITRTEELISALAAIVEQETFVTMDTEFQRENTYWPQLSLVQIHGAVTKKTLLIDALSNQPDMTPLFEFMDNNRILKVFHAARQDLEIFYYLMGRVPQAIFDTQIAAMACGFGDQVGYETLVAHITRQKLDKSQQFSNWMRRPLTERQIAYAKADVIFLQDIYLSLTNRLSETGRNTWIEESMAELKFTSTYQSDPESMWKKLKFKSSNSHYLARLQAVAALREREARAKNVPRGRVLRDDILGEIAHHNPSSVEDLTNIRGLLAGFEKTAFAKNALKVMQAANALPLEACPQLSADHQNRKTPTLHLDFLRLFLKHCAEHHGVSEKLIAVTKDLDQFLALDTQGDSHPLLQGWRYEVFGRDAWALKQGKQGLYLTKRGLETKIKSS